MRPVPTGRGARREATHEEKGGKVESTLACDAEERTAVYLCTPTTPTEQNVTTLRRKRGSEASQELREARQRLTVMNEGGERRALEHRMRVRVPGAPGRTGGLRDGN
jgi:hypothetical protein